MATILIVGLGNAGWRHATNALALGHRVLGFDPRAVGRDVPRVSSLEQGLLLRPDAVVVATPPADHGKTVTTCLNHEIPTLVEKPLAATLVEGEELHKLAQARWTRLGVGYQLRFHKSWKKTISSMGSLQSVSSGLVISMSDMKSWPEVSYIRDVLLEYSHELDLLSTVLTPPWRVNVLYQHDLDWCFTLRGLLGGLSTRIIVMLSGDALFPKREINFVGEGFWQWKFDAVENDEAYRHELAAFLRGERLSDGLEALRLIDAATRSAASGNWEAA